MTFTVWVSEFCVMHVKLQTIYEILEVNRLADLFDIIKTLITPRRIREIGDFCGPYELNYDGNYEHGQKHGLFKRWYDNGQIRYDHNYFNGEYHGIFRTWHENGQIWYENNYEHGERHGIHIGWYDNGQIWYENNYFKGRLIN
jgi:MORN repeat variant